MDRKELDEKMLLLQSGDESAFEDIYRETNKGLFSFILSICKNYHTAEDMMQNTYIRVRQSIATYKGGSNAVAWLYTIAKNLTINELNRRRREVYSDFDDDTKAFGEYRLEDKLQGSVLAVMSKTLNDDEQQIVSLYLVSGFKHREIAEIMQKPLGTVLWSYRNALGKLKKALEKEGYDENTRY